MERERQREREMNQEELFHAGLIITCLKDEHQVNQEELFYAGLVITCLKDEHQSRCTGCRSVAADVQVLPEGDTLL